MISRRALPLVLAALLALPASAFATDDATLAKTFAPLLIFDKEAGTFPMSAETFYEKIVATGSHDKLENKDWSTISSNSVPIYWDITTCGSKQKRIQYWVFYGYQSTCDGTFGSHNGDWEHIVVTLSEDETTPAAITYHMHDGQSTRIHKDANLDGTHPKVWVGRHTHASYPMEERSGDVVQSCLWWYDSHHGSSSHQMQTWNNLVELKSSGGETWMTADAAKSFSSWGHDGVDTHPTTVSVSCSMKACKAGKDDPTGGCSAGASSCKKGDSNSTPSFAASVAGTCLEGCDKGWTNTGLFCQKGLKTKTRKIYTYEWTIPTDDDGLIEK